ncbi:MAG: selenate reductase [Eubacteriales bacterium]|nr:selenate reductase [Eubacteriales bacterium]
MSDIMRAIPFEELMNQLLEEYRAHGTVFAVKTIFKTPETHPSLDIYGGHLEYPLGVAAGPHTQLAQNLAAIYAAGGRFLELKTIQILYGEDLGIPRPCIRADDEAYNVEWSSEYHPDDAAKEYIKGYFLCKILAKEFGLGDPDGFMFNMSCGYNYEGLISPSVDKHISDMSDASNHPMFHECMQLMREAVAAGRFENIDLDFVDSISPHICKSLNLSTMHGCPPDEIEKMARHLIEVKKVNLNIKCNPTLLGYDYVRELLDAMGFDYVKFLHESFDHDLQQAQAFPMLHRLIELAEQNGVCFGVKLTNTFQTEIKNQELPGQAMYMSGKALYPLSLSVAALLAREFGGKLPMTFSGGADLNNIADLQAANITPITVCTILLRPRGLNVLAKLADKVCASPLPASEMQTAGESGIETLYTNPDKLEEMRDGLRTNKKYIKTTGARKKYDLHKSYEGDRVSDYHCRVLCQNCIDVCPNRANDLLDIAGDAKVIVHIDRNCNECGNCQFHCVEPCLPYRDRLTLFHSLEDFRNSENKGLLFIDDQRFAYRFEEQNEECAYESLPDVMKGMVDAIRADRAYLV